MNHHVKPRTVLASFTMAACLVFTAAACGGDDDDGQAATADVTTPEPAEMESGDESTAPSAEASGDESTAPSAEASGDESAAPTTMAAPEESGEAPAFQAEAPERDEVLSPLFSGSAMSTMQWMADDLGLWEKYGLEVDTPVIASTTVIPLVISGEAPILAHGGYSVVPILRAGKAVEVHGWLQDFFAYKFFTTEGINNPKDLEGKSVGISGLGGNPHAAALAYLEGEGVDTSSITFVPLGTISNILPALLSGQVQGGVFGPPQTFTAEDEGLHELADLTPLRIPFPSLAIYGNAEWIHENPNTARAFLRGLLEATWIMFTDPDAAKAVMAEHLEIDGELLDRTYEAHIKGIVPPNAEAAGTSDEVKAAIQRAEQLTAEANGEPAPEPLDLSQIDPASNLFDELEAEGFFAYLEATYGPLPV